MDAGDDVLLLYNEQTLPQLVQLMKSNRMKADKTGDLAYHISLIHLLTLCTEGKNVFTEIKCHSLVPLDDILHIVTHQDCIPEVCSSVRCQQFCDVFQCMQDRQMCVCRSLCMSPCMIPYVTMCPTVYITMFHYMCCRMSPCVTICHHVSLCIMSLFVCHTQVKNVYVQFLMHAYIDTDVELREVYSRDTMWELFENFLPDISTVSDVLKLC